MTVEVPVKRLNSCLVTCTNIIEVEFIWFVSSDKDVVNYLLVISKCIILSVINCVVYHPRC